MIPRPQFKPWVPWVIVPEEGVLLLSEQGHLLLRGGVYAHLAPLLNGQHTVDEVILHLQGQFSAVEVFSALMGLRSRGYIVDEPLSLPPEQAAFWDMLDGGANNAAKRLQEATVSVVSFGAVDPAPFLAMLASLGVQVRNDGQYSVVLADDYLHEDLAAFNQNALASDRPWLLVKPVGKEIWLGPLFLPTGTACWACLAHRLHGARKVESYAQEKLNAARPVARAVAALPSTIHAALNIAATETAKWIVRGRNEDLEGCVVSVNTLTLAKRSHMLARRPQCSHCGDPAAFASVQAMPILLQSRKKAFMTDGGHRTLSPEETLKKLAHHVSPITGIVHTLQPTTEWMGEKGLVLSYITGHNFIHASKDYIWGLDFLDATLRDASAGKGQCPTQAKASALCEAIERYSGVFQGDEARFRAKLKDLGSAAIHPNACMLFSEMQFKNRETWNAVGSPPSWVPEPFDDAKEVEWSPVWSLTHDEPRYVPTAYCYYGYSRKHHSWFARADSNGCAAGHSKEEAILQGFMELIERDCVALWWYNRLQKPAVDLSSFAEPYFQELQAYYQALHRDLWVLDITSDFNIPTFAAISRRNDKEAEDILLGFGAHFDPYIAILRALTEVNQSLPLVSSGTPGQHHRYPDSEAVWWWKTATCKNQPYLVPDETSAPKIQANYTRYWSDDLYTDVMTCVQIAKAKELDTLVLDQTRPDTGLHVMKVIVPGLRHFWPRFAPGRLYEVPVQMGWLTEALGENSLNPQHIFSRQQHMEDAFVDLRDEHVRFFQEQGFLSLGRITTDQELIWLRETYDEIFKRKRGYTPQELTGLLGERTPPTLLAILSPEGVVPTLKSTLFLRNARKAVARLLGVEEAQLLSGWRIFCKPAHGGETPWHQDAAYRPPPHHGASVWMPLDPATFESSCLSYIGRSHLGDVYPHHSHDDHLVADSVDSSQAVACPIAAGEAIVHHCRTLHSAGPNTTHKPRRALVVVCQVNR